MYYTEVFAFISALQSGIVILANISSTKLTYVLYPGIPIDAGFVFFPIVYILNDICTEVLGLKYTKLLILQGVIVNIITVLCLFITIILPPHPDWYYQDSFTEIFTISSRIFIASITSYLIGTTANALVLNRLKMHKTYNIVFKFMFSTSVGALMETTIFYLIAFLFIIPGLDMIKMIILQYILKLLYELLCMPIIYKVLHKLRNLET